MAAAPPTFLDPNDPRLKAGGLSDPTNSGTPPTWTPPTYGAPGTATTPWIQPPGTVAGPGVAQASAPSAPSASTAQRTGNPQADWMTFVNSKGYTGAQGRTDLSRYVDEFNKDYGYTAKAGNPNASGSTDSADFGNGWIDLIRGGDNSWQWLTPDQQGSGGNQTSSSGSAFDWSKYTPTPTTPFVAGARQAQPQSIFNDSNQSTQDYKSLLAQLTGISTGTTPENSNPNLQIDPRTDPIIKPQVEAYDAAQQRSQSRYLSSMAEKAGANGNIGAETRHAAEAGGQATAQYQAGLAQQELGARRTEIQNALSGRAGLVTAQQQMQLQEELKRIDMVEQQYQWDSGLAEKAYEFGQTQDYLNSPLAHL